MEGIDKYIQDRKDNAQSERLKQTHKVYAWSKEDPKKQGMVLTKKIFWALFKEQVGKDFIFNEVNTDVIYTIFKYFLKQEDFNEASNLISNEASLVKGLLVWGDNGVGKTMLFDTIHEIGYKLTKFGCYDLWFRKISAPTFVKDYMKAVTNKSSVFDLKNYYTGALYIDDLGLEDKAFNSEELLGTLLFERDKNDAPTFITTNKKPSELLERYGPAIGDRQKKMFNIIKWKGESFRK